jgi:hypothetical protein
MSSSFQRLSFMTAFKLITLRSSWFLCLAALLLMAESVAAQKVDEMPALPQPADFRADGGLEITSVDPKTFDMFGATMRMVERGDDRNLLVGHSRGVWELTRDESGDWRPVSEIKPPESCANPGTFGVSFEASGEHVALRPVVLGEKARIHVYRQSEAGWDHVQDISPAMLPEGRRFGMKVTVFDDWLCVYGRDGVTVFKKNDAGLFFLSQVIDSEGESKTEKERFGKSVVISGDQMFVSSFRAPRLNERVDVYELTPESKWKHVQVLDPPHRKFGTWFGHVMDVCGDSMVISSPRWKDMAGRVDVYQRGPKGLWTHVQDLDVFPDSLSSFGTTLSLEGGNLVVGASVPNVPGSAYLYEMDSSAGRFNRVSMLGLVGKEHISSGFAGAALMTDGRCFISAPGSTQGAFPKSGCVYAYDLQSASPSE